MLLLVGAATFQLVTGLMNIGYWYAWPFSFPDAHFWTAYIAIGAVIIHAVNERVTLRRSVAVPLPRDPEDADGYRLAVAGLVERPLSFSVDELRALPQHTLRLPITCVEGWTASATWTGVRLRDLLRAAGAAEASSIRAESLQPSGSLRVSVVDPPHWLDPLTLLALQVNGEVLHADHGYPCRLIAPNRPGVLQTKWVGRLAMGRYRGPLQAGLIISGTLTLAALPVVLGFGRGAGEPSRLPLDYGVGLALALAGVWPECGWPSRGYWHGGPALRATMTPEWNLARRARCSYTFDEKDPRMPRIRGNTSVVPTHQGRVLAALARGRAWVHQRSRLLRWGRYTVASGVATGTTELAFVIVYGGGLAGAQTAGIVAFIVGAVPKFALVRWWVWQRRGVPHLVGEVLPYALVVAATGVVAGYLTSLAESAITASIEAHTLRVALVSTAFFVIMAVLFVVRYVLFDRLVFRDRNGRRRPPR
ncbi:MAG: molybdopterin-dependent oxidoreductase [Streptomycetales bacterium]